MTGLLDIEQDERILEISAGSGYRRAVLVTLASKVSSVEYSRGSTNLPKNICQALGTKKFDPSAKRFGLNLIEARLLEEQLDSGLREPRFDLRSRLSKEGPLYITTVTVVRE